MVWNNAKHIQNFFKIINLVLEDKQRYKLFLRSSNPKIFLYLCSIFTSYPQQSHHTSTLGPLSISYFLFLFLLFFFLFSFPLRSQISPSWDFFLPSLLLSSLYFVDGNPLVVAGGSTIFDRMIGFNSNIVVEFWT